MNIKVSNLTKHYSGSDRGVTDLNFSISPGEVVGLIGLNGSGKTTTMKLICGLLNQDSGEIDVMGSAPREARGLIAFHGERDILYPWLTPQDGKKMMSSMFPDFEEDRYVQLLKDLDVPMARNDKMSKGQKSRFRLALTLSRKAKLFVLDEPLSGIDVLARRKIIKTLIEQWRDDASMLISTHEIESAQNLFESVIILNHGKLVLRQSTEEMRMEGHDLVSVFEKVVTP